MAEQATSSRRVLVTGPNGAVGRAVWPVLAQRGHHVRGLSRHAAEGLADMHLADLTDRDKVRAAVEGMDCIVHLAAYPLAKGDFLNDILGPNVIGLYHILDAAVACKVSRVILASTVQTVSGFGGRHRPIRLEHGTAPANHYALSKVWLEAMGEMYARRFGLSVLSVRIGWLVRDAGDARNLARSANGPNQFFSQADAGRFFASAVESDNPPAGQSAIVFAASRAATTPYFDLTPARELIGYEPRDVWPQGVPFEF